MRSYQSTFALLSAFAFCTVANAAELVIGDVSGRRGDVVELEVYIRTMGEAISGTQNDMGLDPAFEILRKANGRADCSVDEGSFRYSARQRWSPHSPGHPEGAFSFRPAGCTPGVDCTQLRTLVLNVYSTSVLIDGGNVYSCRVRIAPDAALGRHTLPCSGLVLSDPDGQRVSGVCSDGALEILDCPGDCNHDDEVTIEEVVSAWNIAQNLSAVETCTAADADGDAMVSIDEIIRALNVAAGGCAP